MDVDDETTDKTDETPDEGVQTDQTEESDDAQVAPFNRGRKVRSLKTQMQSNN